jgi:hypothetical protein
LPRGGECGFPQRWEEAFATNAATTIRNATRLKRTMSNKTITIERTITFEAVDAYTAKGGK